jgi:acetyl-CoA acetyltransferase
MKWRKPGPAGISDEPDFDEPWIPPSHPDAPEAPNRDMSITVGWNAARTVGITREDMDAWALRSHQRAVAAIDDGTFVDEIVPVEILGPDGGVTAFSVDEHPRRSTTMESLAALRVLHPEIEGFSITAGTKDSRCWAWSRHGRRPAWSRRIPVWPRCV